METLVPAQHSENEDEIDTHKKSPLSCSVSAA